MIICIKKFALLGTTVTLFTSCGVGFTDISMYNTSYFAEFSTALNASKNEIVTSTGQELLLHLLTLPRKISDACKKYMMLQKKLNLSKL